MAEDSTEAFVRLIREVAIVPLRPNDVLVLKVEARPSPQVVFHMQEALTQKLGFPVTVMALLTTEDVEVVRPEAANGQG